MKKALKFIGIAIFLFVIIFFSLGFFMPVMNVESRVTVNKPVDASFKIFTSPFKLADWVPGLKGIAWISGSQNQVGGKWKLIITYNGSDYEMLQTLTAFKQDELFVFNTENKLFTNEVAVRFVNKGTSTDIIATSHYTGTNMLWRSVLVFAQSYFHKMDQEMYGKLKEVIEKGN